MLLQNPYCTDHLIQSRENQSLPSLTGSLWTFHFQWKHIGFFPTFLTLLFKPLKTNTPKAPEQQVTPSLRKANSFLSFHQMIRVTLQALRKVSAFVAVLGALQRTLTRKGGGRHTSLPCHPILWDTSVGIHILSVLLHRYRGISGPPFHYVSLAPAFALAGHGGLSFLKTNSSNTQID